MSTSTMETQRRLTPVPASSLCSIRVVMVGAEMILVFEPQEELSKPRLVFESPHGQRAVAGFPADWRTLPEAQLLSLQRTQRFTT